MQTIELIDLSLGVALMLLAFVWLYVVLQRLGGATFRGRIARLGGDVPAGLLLLALGSLAVVLELKHAWLEHLPVAVALMAILIDEILAGRPPRKRRRLSVSGRVAKLASFVQPKSLPRPV